MYMYYLFQNEYDFFKHKIYKVLCGIYSFSSKVGVPPPIFLIITRNLIYLLLIICYALGTALSIFCSFSLMVPQ